MNIILNPGQSNTRKGCINLLGSVNLTGCENLLLKIVNNAGVPNFALPTGVTDIAPYICASGDVAGNNTAAEAPNTGENCRILLDGACNPGDRLCLSATHYGRLYAPAPSAGSLLVEYIAEEAGVDAQALLVRRITPRLVAF
jgi:hypothetical protein